MGSLQRNSIDSWLRTHKSVQVLLFGDESGTAEAAREFSVEHIQALRRNQYGTPLVNDLFRKAASYAAHELICYANSDIIFPKQLGLAADIMSQINRPFLVIGEAINLSVESRLDFADPECHALLEARMRSFGKTRGPLALEYFLFRRDLYRDIPPFAIGRARYDNWLVWQALHSGAAIVDASNWIPAIHQEHDYRHLRDGKREAYRGIEARHNQQLAGLRQYLHLHGILDCTHRLTATGIEEQSSRGAFLKQFWLRARHSFADFTEGG